MYSTPAIARESVDVARSRPYSWSGCEQGRGNVSHKILPLPHANDVTTLGKEQDMHLMWVLKHSQKGDNDLLRSGTMETPLIG